MSFSFVDHNWQKVFSEAVIQATREIILITPFIQLTPVKQLLGQKNIKTKLITRFNLNNFYEGVSDLKALEFLIDKGAEIKGIKNLHAKVYIFGPTTAIITSAAVEAVLEPHFLSGTEDRPTIAVESTPQPDNPQLVLFTTRETDLDTINYYINQAGLSPRHHIRKIIRVNEIPVLGTGKADYRFLKSLLPK